MDGGRLSDAEKGKQKLAHADAGRRPPPPLVLGNVGEPRRPAWDAAANWHAAGAGVRLHLLVPPSRSTSEIEEAPPTPFPYPYPAPSRARPRPHFLPPIPPPPPAPVARLEGRVMELQDRRLRELEQLRRERENEGSKYHGAKRRREGGGEPEEFASAEVQMLQKLRLTGAEVQMLPVVPVPQRNDNSKRRALEEFWKPVVPVPQRNDNSKLKAEEMQAFQVPQCNNSKAWVQRFGER